MDLRREKTENGQKRYEIRATRRKIRQLHTAVKENDLQKVEEILTPDVDVNFSYQGQIAVQIAVSNGLLEMTELLIKYGADIDKYNAELNSVLSCAIWKGHTEVAKLLIQHKADVEVQNTHGAAALNTAAYRGNVHIVKTLIEADCLLNRIDLRGDTPLHCAVKKGYTNVVKALVDAKCDVDLANNDMTSPLITSCTLGYSEISQMLIDVGCNLNHKDRYGCTALYMASKGAQFGSVKQLITAGADLNLGNNKRCTPFHEAVIQGNIDIVKALSSAGCDINTGEWSNEDHPIHSAVRQASHHFCPTKANHEMVDILVNLGCDLNVETDCGWTPVYQAAYGGEWDLVKLMVDHGANVHKTTKQGDTLLHSSIFGNKLQITQCFIDAGCDVNAVNVRNELPLYTALEHNSQLEVIELLLKSGSKTDICENQTNQSPLFCAIKHDNGKAVRLLIDAGADVNSPNNEGDTPLWVACDRGIEEVVDSLLHHPDVRLDQGIAHVPLHAAVIHGFTGIVEKLIKAGCNLNKMTDLCTTALYFAAEFNRVEIAKILIQHGADPSIPARVKRLPQKCCRSFPDAHPHLETEPLYSAIKNDNFALVKMILQGTPRMPYHQLSLLRDLMFRTNYAQEARLGQRLVVQYAHFFSGILSKPRELQIEVRGVLRQMLGSRPHQKVDKLPLPQKLKDYILLYDVMSPPNEQ